MYIILTIIIAYSFMNVFETIYYINNGYTYFGTNLIGSWILYIGAIIFLVLYIVFRRYNQKKYLNIINENSETNHNHSGEYFYQLPVVQLMDNMPIKVEGNNDPYFELYFNSFIHRLLFIFDLSFPPPGLKLSSCENTIILKSRKWLRYEYDIYLNDDYYGEFVAKKLFKDKGIKNYINFTFIRKNHTYNLINNYLDLTAYIKDGEKILLSGDRTYFNFSKDEQSGRRGEKHSIKINNKMENHNQEILLGLYITALNIRNF